MFDQDNVPYDRRIRGTRLVDGHEIAFVVDLLVRDNTVAELRKMARDLDVTRQRGDNKRATAAHIAHQAGYKLKVVEEEPGLKRVEVVDWP